MTISPEQMLPHAPTPEVAALILEHLPWRVERHAAIWELPAMAAEHLSVAILRAASSAAVARSVAVSTDDPHLLQFLLGDERVTVRAAAVFQCHRLGLVDLATRCAPATAPVEATAVNPLNPPPRAVVPDLPQVEVPAAALTDDELFGVLRRQDGAQIAAWLASDETIPNGFRVAVAHRLLRYPKNQLRITHALRVLPLPCFDRIAAPVDPWIDHTGRSDLCDWRSRRFAAALGANADGWRIALAALKDWTGTTDDLAATARACST